jgi:hypothetical protein
VAKKNTYKEANKITPGDNDALSSDLDSTSGDGKGGKDKIASEQAEKLFAGMFSTSLKDKAAKSARDSKSSRSQRACWQKDSDGMTYEERQEYFKGKHKQRDEKAFMSSQPEPEAKMKKKRKNRKWNKNSKVIKGIFQKPAKLLQKEKKEVVQMLDEQFSPTETTGETEDKSVSQISHLKFIPPQMRAFTAKEETVRRKAGLIRKGYEMHVSAYYQGLPFNKKGKSYMID